MTFGKCTESCNHHPHKSIEHFHLPRKFLHIPQESSPQLQATRIQFLSLIDLGRFILLALHTSVLSIQQYVLNQKTPLDPRDPEPMSRCVEAPLLSKGSQSPDGYLCITQPSKPLCRVARGWWASILQNTIRSLKYAKICYKICKIYLLIWKNFPVKWEVKSQTVYLIYI